MIYFRKAGIPRLLKMILRIGNDPAMPRILRFPRGASGLTFVEVMVTLCIVSFALVAVAQVFIVSIDRMNYLTHRLYASLSLDERMESIQRTLNIYNALPFNLQKKEIVEIGLKRIELDHHLVIREVDDLPDVFQIDLTVEWQDMRRKGLQASSYISNFREEF